MSVLARAREKFKRIIIKDNLLEQDIVISAHGLSAEEVIGNPERDDFPLLQGKEVMIQAEFNGSYGQAFTDHPGNYRGSLKDIIALPLASNYQRALLVATINSVLRNLNLLEKTVHCKNEEPELCAAEMLNWLTKQFTKKNGITKLGLIGFQPAILEKSIKIFGAENLILTDLNQKKIGQERYGVKVWSGTENNERLIKEADLILLTGSTIVNGSLDGLLKLLDHYNKRYFIYGNTISGVASLLELPWLCFYGR